jgi:MOSC domain-containing protein YiiM
MRILSVNIGEAKHYPWRGGTDSSIVKTPQKESMALTSEGFEGNAQVDRENHGGEDKAVLILPAENYERFGLSEKGYGYLGENLTIEGVNERDVAIGDHFQIGEVVLEVTQPRSPCWKLSALRNDPHFTRHYAESGRVGWYCRVIQAGSLQAGQAFQHQPVSGERFDIYTLFLAKHAPQTPEQWALLEKAVQHPALSQAWRRAIGKQLENR